MSEMDISDFKQSMIVLLKQDKLQEFIDNMTQIKLLHNQLKLIIITYCTHSMQHLWHS